MHGIISISTHHSAGLRFDASPKVWVQKSACIAGCLFVAYCGRDIEIGGIVWFQGRYHIFWIIIIIKVKIKKKKVFDFLSLILILIICVFMCFYIMLILLIIIYICKYKIYINYRF